MSSIFDSFSNFVGDNGVPLYLLGQGASTYLRGRAQNAVTRRQQQLADQERARQAQFGAQSRGVFDNEAMPAFTPPAAEARRAGEQSKEEALAKTVMTPSTVLTNYNATTGNPSGQDSIATRLGEAVGRGGNYATTGAKMRSYGAGINLGNNILAGTGQKLGRIGRDASLSASILPGELDYANYKGRDMRTASDVLGGAGSLAGLYSLTRKKKPPVSGPNQTFTFGGQGDMSADFPMPV